jgi:hypothetical protein
MQVEIVCVTKLESQIKKQSENYTQKEMKEKDLGFDKNKKK